MEPVTTTPLVDAAANLRRAAILSAGLAVVAIAVTSALGHPLMGLFGTLGLGLGGLNNLMLQRAGRRFVADTDMTKKRFRHGVLRRLAAFTLVALGCALLVRPDGIAVFIGLALFQVIMLVGAAVPVLRSLRPT